MASHQRVGVEISDIAEDSGRRDLPLRGMEFLKVTCAMLVDVAFWWAQARTRNMSVQGRVLQLLRGTGLAHLYGYVINQSSQ